MTQRKKALKRRSEGAASQDARKRASQEGSGIQVRSEKAEDRRLMEAGKLGSWEAGKRGRKEV